jgi:transcriptional regulator with XRE-family HTH domain
MARSTNDRAGLNGTTYAPDSLVVKVGMRIRSLRMERRISLRNFGKQAGVHPFHVMAIELGQLAANTKTLRKIAKALGVTSADLLNHDADAANNDVGAIMEIMRLRPETIKFIGDLVRPLVLN